MYLLQVIRNSFKFMTSEIVSCLLYDFKYQIFKSSNGHLIIVTLCLV